MAHGCYVVNAALTALQHKLAYMHICMFRNIEQEYNFNKVCLLYSKDLKEMQAFLGNLDYPGLLDQKGTWERWDFLVGVLLLYLYCNARLQDIFTVMLELINMVF